MLHAVVDTNVWISGLITPDGPPARILRAVGEGQFIPVLTSEALAELELVGRRPRIRRRGVTDEVIAALIALLGDRSAMFSNVPNLTVSRDPRDDIFIGMAVAANADVLVTRDDDLKRDPAVAAFFEGRHTEVLSVRHFLRLLEAGE